MIDFDASVLSEVEEIIKKTLSLFSIKYAFVTLFSRQFRAKDFQMPAQTIMQATSKHDEVNYNKMADKIFPTLTTARLTLRQLLIDDRQSVFALRSNKEINKYLDRQPSKTIEDAENFITTILQGINKSDLFYWAITLTNSKTFVGTICLFNLSYEHSKCEIGYELLTNFQGQGIMKEAAESVIDFVFQTMRLQKIEAFTHNDNQNSAKLLEKLHFKKSAKTDKENSFCNIFILTN